MPRAMKSLLLLLLTAFVACSATFWSDGVGSVKLLRTHGESETLLCPRVEEAGINVLQSLNSIVMVSMGGIHKSGKSWFLNRMIGAEGFANSTHARHSVGMNLMRQPPTIEAFAKQWLVPSAPLINASLAFVDIEGFGTCRSTQCFTNMLPALLRSQVLFWTLLPSQNNDTQFSELLSDLSNMAALGYHIAAPHDYHVLFAHVIILFRGNSNADADELQRRLVTPADSEEDEQKRKLIHDMFSSVQIVWLPDVGHSPGVYEVQLVHAVRLLLSTLHVNSHTRVLNGRAIAAEFTASCKQICEKNRLHTIRMNDLQTEVLNVNLRWGYAKRLQNMTDLAELTTKQLTRDVHLTHLPLNVSAVNHLYTLLQSECKRMRNSFDRARQHLRLDDTTDVARDLLMKCDQTASDLLRKANTSVLHEYNSVRRVCDRCKHTYTEDSNSATACSVHTGYLHHKFFPKSVKGCLSALAASLTSLRSRTVANAGAPAVPFLEAILGHLQSLALSCSFGIGIELSIEASSNAVWSCCGQSQEYSQCRYRHHHHERENILRGHLTVLHEPTNVLTVQQPDAELIGYEQEQQRQRLLHELQSAAHRIAHNVARGDMNKMVSDQHQRLTLRELRSLLTVWDDLVAVEDSALCALPAMRRVLHCSGPDQLVLTKWHYGWDQDLTVWLGNFKHEMETLSNSVLCVEVGSIVAYMLSWSWLVWEVPLAGSATDVKHLFVISRHGLVTACVLLVTVVLLGLAKRTLRRRQSALASAVQAVSAPAPSTVTGSTSIATTPTSPLPVVAAGVT
eukprot:TRINITY_DN7065_c0_g1_i1.p1 TRINITY_DN7065_c0_g1~~TRINITY_DN7065_c0_g1_i1.p1  ORF type:complete len:792 (+),score=139.21 TRINITY_DN7065_c0_g1_i1:1653-4028(+)